MMKRLSWTVGLLICLAWAGTAWPSETRVDSTGGMTSILTDETTDLSFFMDGNPAGLLLLDTHDRLDEAFQWGSQNGQPVEPGSYQQTFGSIPRLANDNDIHYSGWMAFPAPGWAFQAGGDFLSQSGQTPADTFDSLAPSQYRGILRGATNLGPLVLGLEVRNMETDAAYDQGLYSERKVSGIPYTLQTGSSALNQTYLRGGVASAFPENRGPNDAFWQAGGIFEAQVAGGNNAFNASLVYPGGDPSPSGKTTPLPIIITSVPNCAMRSPTGSILRFSYFHDLRRHRFRPDRFPNLARLRQFDPFPFLPISIHERHGSFRLSFPSRAGKTSRSAVHLLLLQQHR